MVMSTLQIRINDGLLKKIDEQIKNGIYSNRSEAIRDAVRTRFWINEAGTVPNRGKATDQVRKARKALSKEKLDIDKINRS